ncbi:hypothetical protein [Marinobacterium stanieri]|uniref:Uncharacterized protein n=1 Tax=Marinobacterium stanieri TaxID=49186 RepID=A0A1N6QAM6_9GAMM|nr:hypothetical protein [Marinobacterium stanieri]SIQ13592.1 hypothetical protein SAMN05421647_102378 [Marinobacterium stanieri]
MKPKYSDGTSVKTFEQIKSAYPNFIIHRDHPENWPNGPWAQVLPEPVQPTLPALADYKANAHRELVYIFNALADDIAGLYPWFERDTWKDQEYEALTYQSWVNNGSTGAAPSTPTLTGISSARGIALPELVSRVIENSNAWRQVAPQLAGQRQAYADQIEAAADHAAVDSVLEFARAATVSQAA